MSPLLRLKPYLRPHAKLIVAAVLLAIPLAALRAYPAFLVQRFIDELLVSKNARMLVVFPLIFIGLYVVNFGVRFFHYYSLRVVIARVNQKLKNDLFDHLLGLSADHFTAQSTGTLISRVGSDPQHVDGGLSVINVIIREPLTFLYLFATALYFNWKLTLVTLVIFPPFAWVLSVTGRNLKRYIHRMTEENAGLFSILQESFTGIRVIKTFQLERYVRERYYGRSESFAKFLLKTAALEEAAHPMVELIIAFAVAIILYYGGSQVVSGEMKTGELFGFITSFALMMNPIRQMNDVNIKLSTASAACKRIFEIFDWRSRLREPANPLPFETFRDSIRFEQVRFAYPDAPEREILKGLSFEVRKGEVVALVGESGAGKSSLASLLPRVFDVTGGSIRIDGRDLRELRLEDLRRQIAVVSQDVFLFNDSVEENIRCGRLGASREEIRDAARRAHALEFIERLPQGFATVIGDRGQKLSGGEKQRLSIARAFLRGSPILILDEATSSLDTRSEQAVQEALDELIRDRTTLMIAHRLSTIRAADQILVIKAGEIVERGNHQQLLGAGGEYARFHQLQAGQPAG